MKSERGPNLFEIRAGEKVSGDWFPGAFPPNIEVGEDALADSSYCFKNFRSRLPLGFRCGSNVTLWRTSIATEEEGYIEIGDDCYIANASIVAASRITIGSRVFIAGGATIVDSDFHPLDPALRLADVIALSPVGDLSQRPHLEFRPVSVGNDVWIGYNATILKGVNVGDGAVIHPGSVVVRDVAAGSEVSGNPAQAVKSTTE